MLSAAVIGHLNSRNGSPQSTQSLLPCTAFFYFENGNPTRTRPEDAMKAFVAQLIHFYRNDRGMLDGLTLLTETRISGQPRASDEDAEIVLKFLLNRFPCYVILDAIDECAEPLSLLSRISLMCENLDTKILMLSRPDISLPWKYVVAKDKFKVVKLSESCNVPDIELFLEDELGKAIQLGLFGSPEERYHRTSSVLETDSRGRAEKFPHYSAESSTLTWRERPRYRGRLEEQPARHTADSSYVPYESILDEFDAPLSGPAESDFTDCAIELATIAHGGPLADMADLKSICARIATQSKGMFLWARLLTKYLSSPALSPNERLEAVSGVHYLEDIDDLYLSILEKVVKKYQKEKKIALNIFRWLVFALYPLSIDSLHTGVTLLPGRPTCTDDRLVDFAGSIDRITCALVERDERGYLRFIHTSFAHFLQSTNLDLRKSGFSLRDTEAAHSHVAISCLSYLIHDIPRAPLHIPNLASRYDVSLPCGEDERLPSRQEEDLATRRRRLHKKYPLLCYAALCWPEHLTKSKMQIPKSNEHFNQWQDFLSKFLIDRLTVTIWVEACWTFRLSPSLTRLIEESKHLADIPHPIPADQRELIWTLRGLETLSHALDNLKPVSPYIGAEPSRMWLPHIRVAQDPEYWPNWNFEVQHRPEPPRPSSVTGGAGFLPDGEGISGLSLQPPTSYVA